jgi:SAM-dependent methyltransferase
MPDPLASVVALPLVRRFVTRAANWVDLQWSVTVEQLKEVAPSTRGRLLDVGCGTKPYAAIFAPYVAEYVGLEVERSFAATVAAASDAPDVYYDGRRIPFADESFDTVLCIQVLEHTPDPSGLLAEIARVVRRDGTVVLSAPFSFRLHEEPHDYFRYTPHGLDALCERAGLEVTRRWTQGSLWSAFGHALNSYLAFRVAGLGGTLQALGKLTHEGRVAARPRLLALPFVVPGMALVSGGARILDRLLSDPSVALGYQLTARKKRS